jgi:hypothetical protein
MPYKSWKHPRALFNAQRASAKRRKNPDGSIGIPWELTFEEWWAIWEASGKWEQRGRKRGKYCMCRHNDCGPYAVGNVYIGEYGANSSAALKGWGERKRARELKANAAASEGLPVLKPEQETREVIAKPKIIMQDQIEKARIANLRADQIRIANLKRANALKVANANLKPQRNIATVEKSKFFEDLGRMFWDLFFLKTFLK